MHDHECLVFILAVRTLDSLSYTVVSQGNPSLHELIFGVIITKSGFLFQALFCFSAQCQSVAYFLTLGFLTQYNSDNAWQKEWFKLPSCGLPLVILLPNHLVLTCLLIFMNIQVHAVITFYKSLAWNMKCNSILRQHGIKMEFTFLHGRFLQLFNMENPSHWGKNIPQAYCMLKQEVYLTN